MEVTKVRARGQDIDVSRIRRLTSNKDADNVLSYTVQFDGAHDDTDAAGRPLAAEKVGDYDASQRMPKDAQASVGNRMSLTAAEAEESGLLEAYAELFPNREDAKSLRSKGKGKEKVEGEKKE